MRHDAIKDAEMLKPGDGVGIDDMGRHGVAWQVRAIEDCDGHAKTCQVTGKTRSRDPGSDDDNIVFSLHDHS
jgi:hypothetical protein